MKPTNIIRESLEAVDKERVICEAKIRDALNDFMTTTGVEVTGLTFENIELTHFSSNNREFNVADVTVEYNVDTRIGS